VKKIPRYSVSNGIFGGKLKDDVAGKLCEYRDYEKLRQDMQAEIDQLRREKRTLRFIGDKMREIVGDHHWTLEWDHHTGFIIKP
jgi:hypothetical protein